MTENPRTIWIVTEGAYSDYRFICAYESEEDARNAVRNGVGDDCTDVPLIAAGAVPVKVPVWRASAFIWPLEPGKAQIREPWSQDEWPWEVPHRMTVQEHGGPAQKTVNFTGRSRALVAKAVQDRAARMRAELEGIA